METYNVIAQGHVPQSFDILNCHEYLIVRAWLYQIEKIIAECPENTRVVISDHKMSGTNNWCSYEKIMVAIEKYYQSEYRVSFLIPSATVLRARLVLREK